MVKPTILRVVEGTVLPPEIESALKKLLNDYSLETYSQQPDNKKSTQARIDSLYKSFLFLVDALPPTHLCSARITAETLKKYAAECRSSIELSDKDSMKELQKKLTEFTNKLVQTIAINWFEKPNTEAVKKAIEYLNDAEQYVLMKEGRPDLATLTTVRGGDKTEYILQLDRSLTPYNNQLLEELKAIKNRQYPKTRQWFRNELSPYQKDYFCSWMTDTKVEPVDILRDVNTFISFWELVKKDSVNLVNDLESIKKHAEPIPEWYNKLSARHQHLLEYLIADCEVSAPKIDAKLAELKALIVEKSKTPAIFKEELNHLHGIPAWYWAISRHQQFFLQHLIRNAEKLEDVLSFCPSRTRFLPLVANFGTHNVYKIDATGAVPLASDRLRSAHLASRDAIKYTRQVQQRHVESNLVAITKMLKPGQPGIIQTLVSPIKELAAIENVISVPDRVKEMYPPDLALFLSLEQAVAQDPSKANLLTANHPLNYYRLWSYTAADNPKSKLLIDKAEQLANATPGLAELIDIYKGVLNSPRGTATYNDTIVRELFLSSLEHVIILKMGGLSHGSCVSGKDRKGIELIHTDAMLLYKQLYGTWPKSNDEARARFVELFVTLYTTWHQHIHAGFNAPGSDGIKFPSQYLPTDISNAINQRIGIIIGKPDDKHTTVGDDRKASNNEVKHISSELKKAPDAHAILDLKAHLVATAIGEFDCRRLYDALCPTIAEDSLFRDKHAFFNKGQPTGIHDIKHIAYTPINVRVDSSVRRMGMIFSVLLGRPEEPGDRNGPTRTVYDRLRDFFNPQKIQAPISDLVEQAIKAFNGLLAISKGHKAAAKAKPVTPPPAHSKEEASQYMGKVM